MKLVELLAKELDVWPEDAQVGMQDPDPDHTIWFLERNHGEIEFEEGGWRCSGSDFDILISRPSCLASDYDTAIVGRDEWQTERNRQKGGEWKRHRGDKQPVANDVQVEVKFRDGEIRQSHASDFFSWVRGEHDLRADIMQYRVISQPQAEEVEVSKPELTYKLDWVEVDDTKPAANPLAWRDTIIHCQAIIEDCEREIQVNVNLLDSEGLFMQLEPKKGMQAYEVPVPLHCGEWQDGDIVRCVDTELSCADLTLGKEYTVVTRHGEIGVIDDVDDHMCTCIECGELEFVRRP
jgi:hypothetical protein